MTTTPSRRVPEEAAATRGEIEAAIEALEPSDLARVKCFADKRIWWLRQKADNRTADDLIQTAIADLWAGTRRWNKSKVGFVRFLTGAMRSISSNWARSYKSEEALVLEADLRRENEEGKTFGSMDNLPDHIPSAAKQLSDKQTLELIEDLFKDDEEAQMVLTAWEEGYDPAGVRELWGLSQNDYNTIVRRIRRRLTAAGITPD